MNSALSLCPRCDIAFAWGWPGVIAQILIIAAVFGAVVWLERR
jgi:hypothetical protein